MERSLLLFCPLVLVGALAFACSSSENTGAGSSGGTPDAGDTDAGTVAEGGSAGSQCTAARETTLKPIDKVSTAMVSVVEENGGEKLVYVDGSAGGTQNASRTPYVYLNLETASLVEVTDKSALESTEWDLAIKRTIIYTNSGDGGPGVGGAARVSKAFADVTAADGAKTATEQFFDAECNALLDQANFLTTTFSPDWYTYDEANNGVTPVDGVSYVVVGGTGKKYKLAIESYTGKPDGSTNAPSGGYFLIRVAPL